MALSGHERLPLLTGDQYIKVSDVATAPDWWRVPLERAVVGSAGATMTIAALKTASGALANARIPVIGNSTSAPTVLVSEVRDFT